jgi:hypothetical protein
MSERSEERELTALESALRELRPQSEAMDRAVLMYRAGRASAHGWIWRVTTLFSTAAALVLAIALWTRPAPLTVYVAVPPAHNDTDFDSPSSSGLVQDAQRGAWSRYVHLQEQVLLYGLDGLPPSPGAIEEAPVDRESLLNAL